MAQYGMANVADRYAFTVMSGGHQWPGATGPEFLHTLGPRNDDFNASAAIWRFFAAGANAARDRGTVFGSQ